MPHAIRRVDIAGRYVDNPVLNFIIGWGKKPRDVTDHLQLLLRKSGHHLYTTAEREVVRTIKEKCCYVALHPAKEEKDTLSRVEEFRLPDGNVVQVCSTSTCNKQRVNESSLAPNDSELLKSCSIPSLWAKSTRVCTRLSLIRSTVWTWTCGRACSQTSYLAVVAPYAEVSNYGLIIITGFISLHWK